MNIPIKKYGLAGLTLTGAILAVILLVRMASATPDSPADAPFLGATISGIVYLPDGSAPTLTMPLADTFVWLGQPDPDHDLDYDLAAHGRSNVMSSTGAFGFANVAPGRYVLRAVPRDIPPFAYAPSRPLFVDVMTANVTLAAITLTYPSVTGTVYAPIPPSDITPTLAIVHVYSGPVAGKIEVERRWVWPENNGVFVVGGLPTGTFRVQAEPWVDMPYWLSGDSSVDVTSGSLQYISLTLTLPQVKGTVKYPDGVAFPPVPGATVHALAANGARRSDLTGWQGMFGIGDLPAGQVVTLTVVPPPELNWLQPPAKPITTVVPPVGNTAHIPITLTVPDRAVYGWVRTNEAIPKPVRHALVQAFRVGDWGYNQGLTDGIGAYTMTLSPGLWTVSVRPVSSTVPGGWVYPREARLIQFDQDPLASKVKRLDFIVVLADATVSGAVELWPVGSGIKPTFPATVSLRNDEGIGLAQPLDTNGRFSFQVPHGTYLLDLRVDSRLFAAPPPRDIYANPIAPTILPTITLWPRNAVITGTLRDSITHGPVGNVPVIAWNWATHATFETRSDSNGVYVLGVYSSTWLLRPAPLPGQGYVYSGDPASVQALAWQVVNQDFHLTPTDANIHGVLVDQAGTLVNDMRGWATALGGSVRTGAPLYDGTFDIQVPSGDYTVTLRIPQTQDYLVSGNTKTTSVSSGMTSTVTFALAAKNAKIWGDVWNVRTGKTVLADVDGMVWARDEDMWTGTDIKAGNFYTLAVPAGDWRVNYAIDPDSDFVKTAGPRTYVVPVGTTQYVPLPVARKDGVLTGTVVLSDGITPARGAVVIAEALSNDIAGVTMRAPVSVNGRFTMTLASGLYNVRSVLLHGDWRMINPRVTAVLVPRDGSASVTLLFRPADAAITGTITLENPPSQTGLVGVYGWTTDDGYNATAAMVNGVYTLPVLSGHTWKVAAAFDTASQYWITRTAVSVPAAPGSIAHQDLVLKGPKPKPAPVTVMFDASQAQYIELADQTRIFIPAGAMPATGNVILHITPIANAVHHRNGDVLGLSYIFEAYTEDGQAITQNFYQDVVIVLRYDPDELAEMGLNINWLRPAYFSTTTNSWTMPDSFVVDEARNEITLQIDHFTKFGALGVETPYAVFLPVVLR